MTEFERAEFDTTLSLLKKGYSMPRIHELTGVPLWKLEKNFSNFLAILKQCPIGHKDEPYYETEDEMLSLPQYSYESLSEDEKRIFHDSYRES
jgi:hypothetical protein